MLRPLVVVAERKGNINNLAVGGNITDGNVEKSRQWRSRHFAVMSTLRSSKGLRPCWTDFFEHSLTLTMSGLSGTFIGY